MDDLQIFLLFHEKGSELAFTEVQNLIPVDLNAIRHDGKTASPELAENRFFLNPPSLADSTNWVALCSARWDEKWPAAVKIGDLNSLTGLQNPNQAYSPSLTTMSKAVTSSLYCTLVFGHPGIEAPLRALVREFNLDLPLIAKAPWANSFVVHRDVYLQLVEFWNKVYVWADSIYGLNFHFGFRCLKCARKNPNRIGRYGRERLAGFFYERVTMLFFAGLQLEWVGPGPSEPTAKKAKELRSKATYALKGLFPCQTRVWRSRIELMLSGKSRCMACGLA